MILLKQNTFVINTLLLPFPSIYQFVPKINCCGLHQLFLNVNRLQVKKLTFRALVFAPQTFYTSKSIHITPTIFMTQISRTLHYQDYQFFHFPKVGFGSWPLLEFTRSIVFIQPSGLLTNLIDIPNVILKTEIFFFKKFPIPILEILKCDCFIKLIINAENHTNGKWKIFRMRL